MQLIDDGSLAAFEIHFASNIFLKSIKCIQSVYAVRQRENKFELSIRCSL